jgi:hypothetical protein
MAAARSSAPCNGCTLSIPALRSINMQSACCRSIWLQRKEHSSCARRPWRYARSIAVASRAPFRPRFLAASINRSTSASVRYSRGRYAALGCRRSVRFNAVGVVSVIFGLSCDVGCSFGTSVRRTTAPPRRISATSRPRCASLREDGSYGRIYDKWFGAK